MQLGVLNKIDQDLKNSNSNRNSENALDDNIEENDNVNFPNNY